MWPCLLIALALLGTVPISRSAVPSPAVEDEEDVKGLEMPKENSGCLGARDKQVLSVPCASGNGTCRYVLIPQCQSFCHAQQICAQHYCGSLVSIHDCHTNTLLVQLLRQQCSIQHVWIGGVCQSTTSCPTCYWTDHSPWNYSQWAPGHPRSCCRICTALCTYSGRWESVNCNARLPFICQI